MPKIRKIASIERGLEEIVQSLTEEEIKQAINKGASYVRKCSDPQPDNDGIKRNIDHIDSVKLDIKCIEKGISPPLLTAHQFIIDQAKSELKTNLGEVNEMLVKFSILEGELNKVVIQATDPASPGGKKIDDLEKKKIFEAIKNIEDKILKIKLAIDKSK
tara:strand:+ start:81 stop:560 length:480 start_codon:yes stop_codon:yes gene_type:complete